QQSFLRPFEPREHARLLERLGRRGNRLRFRDRRASAARLGAPRSCTAGNGQRLRDAGIVRRGALRRLEMGCRLLYVADLEIEEREPLQRPDMDGALKGLPGPRTGRWQ